MLNVQEGAVYLEKCVEVHLGMILMPTILVLACSLLHGNSDVSDGKWLFVAHGNYAHLIAVLLCSFRYRLDELANITKL